LPGKWGSIHCWTDCRASFPAASVNAWRWRAVWSGTAGPAAGRAVLALDPALRQEMLTLVSDVCQRQHLTLLMVSHSVEDAARIAPRSLVVADGRIAWDGATETLLSGNSSASHLLGISAR
jgi:hypothetical protein